MRWGEKHLFILKGFVDHVYYFGLYSTGFREPTMELKGLPQLDCDLE